MDTNALDTLEAKIGQILDLVRSLQNEKSDLQSQIADWRLRYEEASTQVEDLSRERDLLKRNQRDLEQEELIRSKIAALLAKLDAA